MIIWRENLNTQRNTKDIHTGGRPWIANSKRGFWKVHKHINTLIVDMWPASKTISVVKTIQSGILLQQHKYTNILTWNLDINPAELRHHLSLRTSGTWLRANYLGESITVFQWPVGKTTSAWYSVRWVLLVKFKYIKQVTECMDNNYMYRTI